MNNLPLPVEVHDNAEGGAGRQDDDDESDKTHDGLGPHPVRTHAVVDREGHHWNGEIVFLVANIYKFETFTLVPRAKDSVTK